MSSLQIAQMDVPSSRRHWQFSLAALLGIVTVMALCGGVSRILFVRYQGNELDGSRANARLAYAATPVRVPKEAKNVTFDAGYLWAVAMFEVEERGFREWAKSYGFKLEEVIGGTSRALQNLESCFVGDFSPSITCGYSYSNSSHRGGWNVVYDRTAKKAWVSYSHH